MRVVILLLGYLWTIEGNGKICGYYPTDIPNRKGPCVARNDIDIESDGSIYVHVVDGLRGPASNTDHRQSNALALNRPATCVFTDAPCRILLQHTNYGLTTKDLDGVRFGLSNESEIWDHYIRVEICHSHEKIYLARKQCEGACYQCTTNRYGPLNWKPRSAADEIPSRPNIVVNQTHWALIDEPFEIARMIPFESMFTFLAGGLTLMALLVLYEKFPDSDHISSLLHIVPVFQSVELSLILSYNDYDSVNAWFFLGNDPRIVYIPLLVTVAILLTSTVFWICWVGVRRHRMLTHSMVLTHTILVMFQTFTSIHDDAQAFFVGMLYVSVAGEYVRARSCETGEAETTTTKVLSLILRFCVLCVHLTLTLSFAFGLFTIILATDPEMALELSVAAVIVIVAWEVYFEMRYQRWI